MRAIVALSTAAALFLAALVEHAIAQPLNYYCNGPFNGCGANAKCFYDPGQCADWGVAGGAYVAYDQFGYPAYSCAEQNGQTCNPVGQQSDCCDYTFYANRDLYGDCSNQVCRFGYDCDECKPPGQ